MALLLPKCFKLNWVNFEKNATPFLQSYSFLSLLLCANQFVLLVYYVLVLKRTQIRPVVRIEVLRSCFILFRGILGCWHVILTCSI